MEDTITITVTLDDDVKTAMDAAVREEGVSPDELVATAVKEYLFFRRFRLLQERMIPRAQEKGIYTDQDVFDRIS
jgi:metal-responsive CopG/Arc/MetJ family transcriptional regulator